MAAVRITVAGTPRIARRPQISESLTPLRQELLEIIQTKALKKLPEPVKLSSGDWSSDFVDGKEALSAWEDLFLASRAMVETVRADGHAFDCAGGLTLGADALAVGLAAASESSWFIVRKEPKKRGTNRLVEGLQIGPGNKVLVVDDVVTTSASMVQAYEVISATGAEVVAVTTLLDRGDQATERFAELGVPYYPMATYKMLGIDRVGPASG